jgi:hypothetical protein
MNKGASLTSQIKLIRAIRKIRRIKSRNKEKKAQHESIETKKKTPLTIHRLKKVPSNPRFYTPPN